MVAKALSPEEIKAEQIKEIEASAEEVTAVIKSVVRIVRESGAILDIVQVQRDVFDSYVRSGFSQEQAMQLLTAWIGIAGKRIAG